MTDTPYILQFCLSNRLDTIVNTNTCRGKKQLSQEYFGIPLAWIFIPMPSLNPVPFFFMSLASSEITTLWKNLKLGKTNPFLKPLSFIRVPFGTSVFKLQHMMQGFFNFL